MSECSVTEASSRLMCYLNVLFWGLYALWVGLRLHSFCCSFPGESKGVTIEGRTAAVAGPPTTTSKAAPTAAATDATSGLAASATSAATTIKEGAANLVSNVSFSITTGYYIETKGL